MLTALGEIVVDRERHTVQSPKFMLTIVWNPISDIKGNNLYVRRQVGVM
jgi:hypothetical protein